ncbi:MAG: sugar phosphate isomerase/epimerase family protein [Fimbriimonas sp.]
MPVRLGIGTYTLSWAIGGRKPLDHFDLLRITKEVGFSVLQVCENLPLGLLSAPDLDRFALLAQKAGIQIEVGTRGLDPSDFRAHVALAKFFGAEFVRLVIDKGHDEPSPEDAVMRLRPLAQIAEDDGLILAIENHDRFTAETLRDMVEELGPGLVGVVLDTANSLACLEGPLEVARVLAPYTVCVHIKDVRAVRESHNLGFRVFGTAAGEGSVPCQTVLEEVLRHRQDFSAILELWSEPQQTEEATIRYEREMLDRSLPLMRHLGRVGGLE